MNLRPVKIAALIVWEYLKRNIGWAIAGLILLTALLIAQVKLNLFYSPNILKIGLIGTYQEHDLPQEVIKLLSTGLVEASSDARIKSGLASSWEVNYDATQFRFKLRDDVTWVDNTKLKAADLEFAIPDTAVTFPDDQTIQFTLKDPYSPLPSLLIKPVFKKGTLLGIGPYRITRIEKSRIFITKIALRSNDAGLPAIDIRFYPSEKVAVAGFNLGEVQVLMGLTNPGELTSNPLTVLKTRTDYSKIVTILFQTNDFLLRNRSLRQALAYQTPQIPNEETANNPYPPNFWAYNNDAKKYLSNPQEAAAALERAKTSLPDDKLHSEIILTSTSNLSEAGKIIVSSWKNLGFDAKLRVESGIPQNFQALLITQSIPADPDQYFLWHATQVKTNLTKYDSKRVDKDLEDARKIIPEDERKTKYFDFQKSLLEDAPAVFLYFPKYNIVYLKKAEPFINKMLDIR